MLGIYCRTSKERDIETSTIGQQKKQFEEGRKVHQQLFGYKKVGKNERGYTIWEPVESEIETYKYMVKRYNEGASLRKISFCVIHSKISNDNEKISIYWLSVNIRRN
jgi:hypothetical protein